MKRLAINASILSLGVVSLLSLTACKPPALLLTPDVPQSSIQTSYEGVKKDKYVFSLRYTNEGDKDITLKSDGELLDVRIYKEEDGLIVYDSNKELNRNDEGTMEKIVEGNETSTFLYEIDRSQIPTGTYKADVFIQEEDGESVGSTLENIELLQGDYREE